MKKTTITRSNAQTDSQRREKFRDMLDAMDAKARANGVKCLSFRWLALATDISVSLHTVQHWARQGRVNESTAKMLELKYGVETAPAKKLMSTK